MDKEYEIRGIDKILGAVSKEDLARFFGVEQDADFVALITRNLSEYNVPTGLEIAGYEATNYEDMKKGIDGYLQDLCEKYIRDGKATVGITYPITNADLTELYFYIDEPVSNEDLHNIYAVKTFLGGVSTLGYTMGKGFYEEHKDEIEKFQEEYRKPMYEERDFDEYVRKYFDRLSGKKVEEENQEYYFDYERERAEEEKKRMAKAEELISKLTGGKSIQQVTLQDLEQIKQGLKARQEKVQEAFEEKFGDKKDTKEK
ncbi:MAG: hypothetical protein J5507_06705 [Clostridia bacterium]|nr:hypothetical protein [Clostridia bacterium]